MNCPSVAVIVLNHNGKQYLEDCFSSLLRLDYPQQRREFILVDNASTDGSAVFLAERFPEVRVVPNASNLGFAAGNNRGAEMAQGEYIAFLNNDTRVAPQWLRELIQPCLREPGVVCTASNILDWEGKAIDFAGAAMNFMGWGSQPDFGSQRLRPPQDHDLLFPCGGGMLIKRGIFQSAGGFDPDYFAFFEDVDLGWRLRLMGHRIFFAARAVMYHRHHGSWSLVNNAQKWVLYERNTLASVIKNYDESSLARVLPAVILLMLLRAFLDMRVDPRSFVRAPTAATISLEPRYYTDRARQLLRERAYGRLIKGAIRKLILHSRESVQPPSPPATRVMDEGQIDVPALAISRLVAGRDVLHAFPELICKRELVQSARRRMDRQVFPLFRSPFVSNFDDEHFIRAMQLAIARFGLLSVFEGNHQGESLDSRVIERSRQVSLALLGILDRTFALTGVPEASFRLGGPLPENVTRIPVQSIRALAEMSALFWSLPDAPLEQVLNSLADGCQRIQDSMGVNE